MFKRVFSVLFVTTLILILLPFSQGKANVYLPLFDHTYDTLLRSDSLYYDKRLARVNQTMRGYTGQTLWTGPIRYPTVYHGHPDDGGYRTSENKIFTAMTKDGNQQVNAFDMGFFHLAGHVDIDVAKPNQPIANEPHTGFNVQRIGTVRSTPGLIPNVFGGNEEYAFKETPEHTITSHDGFSINYGKFYWIRDLARWSGGEATNMGLPENALSLQIIKTDPPDITKFNSSKTTYNVGEQIKFAIEGYEYVSENRTKMSFEINITGPENKVIKGNFNSSKGVTNPAKNNLRRYTGKYEYNNATFTPGTPGRYTLNLTVTDEVMRSTTKSYVVTVNGVGDGGGDQQPPEIPPIVNEPPTVYIDAPNTVVAGDYFCIRAVAHDSDGYIDGYYWSTPHMYNGPINEESSCNATYDEVGYQTVYVTVVDDGGATAEAIKTINVLEPIPTAIINTRGTLKENRKVELVSNGYSPPRFPINWANSYITVEPLDGQDINSIKHLANNVVVEGNKYRFQGQREIDMLFKETGRYKLELYVQNTAGYSNTTESVINIAEDLPPTADFSTVNVIYREARENEKALAVIKVSDKSVSEDDLIGQRIWTIKYDSNNDGNFDDEESIIIDNNNERTIEVEVDKVGDYKIELEVIEEFGQPTIEQFITPNDYKRANTNNKNANEKIIKVDNLAPIVSYDVIPSKVANLSLVTDLQTNEYAALEEELNTLKVELNEQGIELKTDITNKATIVGRELSSDSVVDHSEFNNTVIGINSNSELIVGNNTFSNIKNVKKVGGKRKYNVVLLENGEVYGWGRNNYFGQIPSELNETSFTTPRKYPDIENAVDFVQGEFWLATLRDDGKIYNSGIKQNSTYVIWTTPPTHYQYMPQQEMFKGQEGFTKIVGDGDYIVALDVDGFLWGWGNNTYGALGNVPTTSAGYSGELRVTTGSQLHKIPGIENVKDVFSFKGNTTIAITNDDKIYIWGDNYYSRLGIANENQYSNIVLTPTEYKHIKANEVKQFVLQAAYYGDRVNVLKHDGTVGYLSTNGVQKREALLYHYYPWADDYTPPRTVKELKDVQAVGGDPKDHYFIFEDGSLYISHEKYWEPPSYNYAPSRSEQAAFVRNGMDYFIDIYGTDLSILRKVGNEQEKDYAVLITKNAEPINNNYGTYFPFLNLDNSIVSNLLEKNAKMYVVAPPEALGRKYYQQQQIDLQELINLTNGTTLEITELISELYKTITNEFKEEESIIDFNNIDLYFGVSNTTHNNKDILQQKINSIIVPKLNDEGINLSSLTVTDFRLSKNKSDFVRRIQGDTSGSVYSSGIVNETMTIRREYSTSYTVSSWTGINSPGGGGVGHPNFSRVWVSFDVGKEYAFQAEHATEPVFFTPSSLNVGEEITIVVRRTTEPTYATNSKYIDVFDVKTEGVKDLTKGNLTFASFVIDQALNEQDRLAIIKEGLIHGIYTNGLGTSINRYQFEEIIKTNMSRGTFIDNSNIDKALEELADYIIKQLEVIKTRKEMYITLDEKVSYKTYYKDSESDIKFDERWRYEHEPKVFENDLGLATFNNINRKTPVNLFDKVGKFKVNYSAQDNPIWWNDQRFANYRKWAKELDNWDIYVHRKPVADFTFTINRDTGDYTINNKAYDLDKLSIDIGNGGGILDVEYKWRKLGELEWNVGLPTNPLTRDTFEVMQKVTDFQGATATITKQMDASGTNKPPIADFVPIPDSLSEGEVVTLQNLSYDPNGDPLTYEWWIKTKGASDSTYTVFSNAEHPQRLMSSIGEYTFRLRARDNFGAYSNFVEKDVTVVSANTEPIPGFTHESPYYIGDTILLTSTAYDSDGDNLDYRYVVELPTGQVVEYTMSDVELDAETGNLTLKTTDPLLEVGVWKVTQYVTDRKSAEVSFSDTIIVNDLSITGYVEHTDEWKSIHEEKGNPLDHFYSGEVFVLKADLMPLDSNYVYVQMEGTLVDGSPITVVSELDKQSSTRYTGELFENTLLNPSTRLKNDIVKFTFYTEYVNGYVPRPYIVEVQIIGSVYEVINIYRTN